MQYNNVVKSKTFTVSGNLDYSEPYALLLGGYFSIQVVYTGGAGTGMLQFSNNGTDWADVDETIAPFSGSDCEFYDILGTGAAAVRLKFQNADGMTGTIYCCGGVR